MQFTHFLFQNNQTKKSITEVIKTVTRNIIENITQTST